MSAVHIPDQNNVRFLHGDPIIQNSAKAEAVRGCAARASIFGMPHNHELHRRFLIRGMRAR